MDNKADTSNKLSLAAIACAGAAIGWGFNRNLSRRKKLEEHRTLLEKVRHFDQKLYEDGWRRANQIQAIKQDVQTHIDT
ncbi:hypothetical protein [Virgibacillus sediminis]|uniref:YtxH domain-containing protein n=1 Tax=Virgibacillus sediminis TaxID=202260 RepID=A0ABV7A913_9BACI